MPNIRDNIESLHYPHARRFIEKRLPGLSPEELRRQVYEQTVKLYNWYHGLMREEPSPYRETIEGYIYAYMPRGYRWIYELAGQSPELQTNLETAKRAAVIGAGPAPELWSLFQGIKNPELVELFDTHMEAWWPVVEHFTFDLLLDERRRDLLFDMMSPERAPLDIRKLRKGAGPFPPPGETYDIIVAQQVLNEIHSGDKPSGALLQPWFTNNLTADGTLIILEREERVLDATIAYAFREDRPRIEKLTLSGGTIEASQQDLNWPQGDWGDYKARIGRSIQAAVIYRRP